MRLLVDRLLLRIEGDVAEAPRLRYAPRPVLARALVGRMHGCRQPERFGAGKETIPKLS